MVFEEKKRLPGWAYMIVGVIIIAYTRFIQSKMPTARISIFFWVGIAFVIFGLAREAIPRILTKKPKKELVGPPPTQQHVQTQMHPAGHRFHEVSPHATHQHTQPQQHPSHPYQPLHKQCPRCHQLTHGQGRFCHNCGHQFF